MAFVKVIDDGVDMKVFSPFAAKDTIKSMPSRRWDKDDRCWVVPSYLKRDLLMALELDGFEIRYEQAPRKDSFEDLFDLFTRPTSVSDWVRDAFTAAGDRAPKLYRALASVFHPDAGGEHALMVRINEAYDKWRTVHRGNR